MTKRGILIATLITACASAGTAARAEGGYVASGGSRIIHSDESFSEGFSLSDGNGVGSFGSVGYRWDQTFATEIEGGLRARALGGAAQADNGRGADENTKVLMLNARIAPDVRTALKPYAGVGAGMALVRTNDHSLRDTDDQVSPAGQALAGFSLDMSERTSFFAEYRYLRMLESSSSSGRKDDSHSGFVGLRVKLGKLK